MANAQLIEEIVSEKGYSSIDRLESGLLKTKNLLVDNILAAEKFNQAVGGAKSLKDFDKNAASAQLALEKLNKAQQATALAEEKVQQARLKTAQITEQAAAKQAAAQDKLIKKQQEATAAMEAKTQTVLSNSQAETDAYNNTVNGVEKVTVAINAKNVVEAQGANAAVASTSATKDRTENVKKSAAEIKKENFLIAEGKYRQQEYTKELKNSVRELNNAKGSLEQRRAALIRLNDTYDKLSASERESAYGQRLQGVVKGVTEQVKTLEAQTGRAQRNVGNYGSALKKAFSGIREVANILPGIGVSGIFLLGFEAITSVISALGGYTSKAKDSAVAAKELGSAVASTEYVTAVQNVQELRTNIGLAKEGFISKEGVLKQYNETIGKTTGQVTDLNQAELALNKNADAYIKFTLLKAAANSALQEAGKKAVEAAQAALAPSKASELNADSQVSIMTRLRVAFSQTDEALVESKNKNVKTANDQKDQLLGISESFSRQAAEIAKKSNFNFFEDSKTTKGSGKVNTGELDAQKARVEELKIVQKEIVDNDKAEFDERLSALKNYISLSDQISRIDENKKIKQAKGNNQDIKAAQAEFNTDIAKSAVEYGKLLEKITQDNLNAQEKLRLAANQKEISDIKEEEALKLDQLQEAYAKRSIGEKQYQELTASIQREYAIKYIDKEIEQAQELLRLSTLTADQRSKAEKDLTDLKLKYSRQVRDGQIQDSKDIAEEEKKAAETRASLEKQLTDAKKQLRQELFTFAKAIGNASFENRINEIQDEIDLNEKKKATDIENVNESVASEADKADQIAIINARADAQQRLLEQKQRQEKEKQARFNKAANIVEIIGNTAVAVMKTYAEFGFPLGVPLAIAQAAIGALQVATVLATPIPKYEKGTGYSKAGLALTDEAGAELYLPPNGNPYIGSDSPNIKNLQAGTKIIPHKDLIQMLSVPELEVSSNFFDFSPVTREIMRSNDKVVKAIAKNKTVVNGASKRGFLRDSERVRANERWLNRNS